MADVSADVNSDVNSEPSLFELTNARGDRVRISNFGAAIIEWWVEPASPGPRNIVLGLPYPGGYETNSAYHGVIAGRYCNRIRDGKFSLEGRHYQLSVNDGEHHLHGGLDGFSQRLWTVQSTTERSLTLTLHSPDGDQGYPGGLDVELSYSLDETGTLNIEWQATTDADTVVNLTSHCYFNLSGSGAIGDHRLRIAADKFTPVDAGLIPTGELLKVAGTAMDLREFSRIDSVLSSTAKEIRQCSGLDHNWAFETKDEMALQAELECPDSSLLLRVSSTLPGIQCYTGNHLAADGVHSNYQGLCLEPQYYPDSPNQPHFPSPVLRKGEVMQHAISYQVAFV